jgi:hypothetical protein
VVSWVYAASTRAQSWQASLACKWAVLYLLPYHVEMESSSTASGKPISLLCCTTEEEYISGDNCSRIIEYLNSDRYRSWGSRLGRSLTSRWRRPGMQRDLQADERECGVGIPG